MYVATMSSSPSGQSLATEFVSLIHAFGVLRTDSTPCGQPMSVSSAHALCELASSGSLHQKELATRLGLDASTVSRLVDQFEKKQWAMRASDPDSQDNRVRLIELTAAGTKVAESVLDARAQRYTNLLGAIDSSKRAQVLESLRLLKEAANDLS